jgi:hypothetical protein
MRAYHHVRHLNIFVHGTEERVGGDQLLELRISSGTVVGLAELLSSLYAFHQRVKGREINAHLFLGVPQIEGLF